MDRKHVHRDPNHWGHVAWGGVLHRLQRQVASDQGVRDRQPDRHSNQDFHEGNGGLRLLRLLRHWRHHRSYPGRISPRRHHHRHGRKLAARQGARARRARQALVPRGQPGQPTRCDVLRYRWARHRDSGKARHPARGTRSGRSTV
ncbi:hypothetical protein D3C86_1555620 [compost metagenome]